MRILAAAILLAGAAAPQNANQVTLDQLRAFDDTVGTVAYTLATGGVSLCPNTAAPLSGFRIHTLGQYGKKMQPDAVALFGLGDYPAILAVAPESPAERAGLKTGDWIVSVDGKDMAAGKGYDGVAQFDSAIEAALARSPATLVIEREGKRQTVRLIGKRGCASRVELLPGRKLNASADGTMVQLTTAVLGETRSDDELAFVIAHEMAHNILKHRERLDRIGRASAHIRTTEVEADRMALRLMQAAGYDVNAAAAFWDRFGRKTGAGIFSDGTHMRTKDRVALLRYIADGLTKGRAAQ